MHSKDKNIYKIENVDISLNTLKLDKEWKINSQIFFENWICNSISVDSNLEKMKRTIISGINYNIDIIKGYAQGNSFPNYMEIKKVNLVL